MIVAKKNEYWISPSAISITLNALGDPNRIQCSVAMGAVVMVYIRGIKPASSGAEYAGNGDGLELGADHNPRRWPITISPTKFNTNTPKYVYVAIPRSTTIGTQAIIVFPSEQLDLYGRTIVPADSQAETEPTQVGSTDYFYINLNGIISSSGDDGQTPRSWSQQPELGTLDTYEDVSTPNSTDWYSYSSVTSIVTFLKEIAMAAGSKFQNLVADLFTLNGRTLTGVANADTPHDSDDTIVTPAYLDGFYDDKYLRKDTDDRTEFSLGVGGNLEVEGVTDIFGNTIIRQDLTVGGDVTAENVNANVNVNAGGDVNVNGNGNVNGNLGVGGNLEVSGSGHVEKDFSIGGIFDAIKGKIDELRSHNYSGSGLGDAGWMLTNDDGSGSSLLEVDKLLVRMKATFNEVEIRKETFSGGNVHYSPAGSVVFKVDYLTADGLPLGYREQKVPWLMRGKAFFMGLFGKSYTRIRKIRYAETMSQLSEAELSRVAKFRLYLISDDGTTATRNWWQVGDQARCQTFNKAATRSDKQAYNNDPQAAQYDTDPSKPGSQYETATTQTDKAFSTDFYWRLISNVGSAMGDDGKMYDWVEMPYEGSGHYDTDAEKDSIRARGSGIPQVGDTIVCMGNRTDTERMNLVSILSVGSDAPALKAYRGVHTFQLGDDCLVFNFSPVKVRVRSKDFEFIADDGSTLPVPLERGDWNEGTRYHYYDRISHNGSIWLCQVVDGKVWVDAQGHEVGASSVSNIVNGEGIYEYASGKYDHYFLRGTANGATVYQVSTFTTDEPVDSNSSWMKQVGKGTEITEELTSYAASTDGVTPPAEDSGKWMQTIADTEVRQGQYLWTRRTTRYSDGREDVVSYSVSRWGIDGDGISSINSYYAGATEVKSMPRDDSQVTWYDTFNELVASVQGGLGKMQGWYVWEKTVIKYDPHPNTDGTDREIADAVSYQCNRIGVDGQIGQGSYYCLKASDKFSEAFGGYTYAKCGINWYRLDPQTGRPTENFRLASEDNINTDVWTSSQPAYAGDEKKFLWQFEYSVDGKGTQYASLPICISNISKEVKGIVRVYACSKYQTPRSGGKLPDDIWKANGKSDTNLQYSDNPQNGQDRLCTWSDEHYSRVVTETLPYQWKLTVTKYTDGTENWVYELTVVRGTNGEDGAGDETIYTRNNTGETPETPTNPQDRTVDDYVPDGWTDNPRGIDFEHQFEFESVRKLGGKDEFGRKVWGDFSTPKLRSNWGKAGVDGDGVEYVFIRTKNDVAPVILEPSGNGYQSMEWEPYVDGTGRTDIETNGGTTAKPRCTDDPKGISREWPYEWAAKRTMGDPDPETGRRLWKSYYECTADSNHKMARWEHYSENAIRLDIDNEMDMVQTDSAGKVVVARTVKTLVHLYDGAKEETMTSASLTTDGTKAPKTSGIELAWSFAVGDTISTMEKPISYEYNGTTYNAVFTIAASMGQAIYQLKPSHSALPCTRNASDNSLSAPPALSLSVVKIDGKSSAEISPASYGRTLIRYSKGASATMPATKTDGKAWPSSDSLQATNTDENVYIALFNSDGVLLDRETIPVVKDGADGDGIVSITKKYAVSAHNAPDSNSQDYPTDITSWKATSDPVTDAQPYLWVKEEIVYKYKTPNDVKYYYQGKKGDNGIDAKDVEWVYIRTKTNVPPVIYDDEHYTDSHTPTGRDYTKDDHLPQVDGTTRNTRTVFDIEVNSGTWQYPECTDDPKGVDDTWKYEWEIKRTKGDADDYGNRTWNYYYGEMTLHNNLAESALVIDIDNDNDQFGVDADGKVLVQQTRSTVVTLLYGTEEQAFLISPLSVAPSASLKYDNGNSVPNEVAEASIEPVSGTSNKEYRVTVTIYKNENTPVFTKNGRNGLYVDITGSCAKGGPKTIRFTLEKVMSGEQGVSPTIYQLALTGKSFSYGRSATNELVAKSNSITVRIKETTGDNSRIISLADSGLTCTYKLENDSTATTVPSDGVVTVNPSQVGTNKKVIFTLVDKGDVEDVPIVVDGTNGTSPYFADLDNEMESVACNKNGEAAYDQEIVTNVSLWRGSLKVSMTIQVYMDGGTAYTNGVKETQDLTKATWNNTTGKVTLTVYSGHDFHAGSGKVSVERYRIHLAATDGSNEERDLYLNVNGVMPGEDGSPAALYRLVPSCSEIAVKKNGSRVPSGNITCDVTKNVGGTQSTPASSEYTLKTIVDGTEKSSSTVAASSVTTNIIYELRVGGYLVDRETIPVVSDGEDGDTIKNVEIFKIAGSKPSTPTSTAVPPSGWSLLMPAMANSGIGNIHVDSSINGWNNSENNSFPSIGGWRQAEGKSVDDAFIRERVWFTPASNSEIFVVEIAAIAEMGWDYVYVGALNTDVTTRPGDNPDANNPNARSTDGKSSGQIVTVETEVTNKQGVECFVDIIFSKDGSGNTGADSGFYRIASSTLWKCWGTTVNGVLDSNGWQGPVKVNGVDGSNGKDGNDGADGYSVVANPSSLVLGELLSTQNSFSLPQYIEFLVQGNSSVSVSNVSVKSFSNVTASRSNSTKIQITAVDTTDNPTRGYVVTTVTLSDGTTHDVTVPIAINWQGTIKTTIQGSVEETITSKVNTAIENGHFVTTETTGVFIRSDELNVSQLNETVDGAVAAASEAKQTAREIKMSVGETTFENYDGVTLNYNFYESGSGHTIRNSSWQSGYWATSGSAYSGSNYMRSSNSVSGFSGSSGYLCYDRNGGSSIQILEVSQPNSSPYTYALKYVRPDDFTTPDDYTVYAHILSFKKNGSSWAFDKHAEEKDGNSGVVTITPSAGTIRFKVYFKAVGKNIGSSISTSIENLQPYFCIVKMNNSLIQQTAEQIKLQVAGCGINIETGKVDVLADNFTVHNSDGEQTLGLNASGDFEVGGTVKAKNFYHNVCIVNSGGNNNVDKADIVVIGGSGVNTSSEDIIVNLPSPSTYTGKVITIHGAQKRSSLEANRVQVRFKVNGSSSFNIYTAWGTTGIYSANNSLRDMNEMVLYSNGSNWMIYKWTAVDSAYEVIDVLSGLT